MPLMLDSLVPACCCPAYISAHAGPTSNWQYLKPFAWGFLAQKSTWRRLVVPENYHPQGSPQAMTSSSWRVYGLPTPSFIWENSEMCVPQPPHIHQRDSAPFPPVCYSFVNVSFIGFLSFQVSLVYSPTRDHLPKKWLAFEYLSLTILLREPQLGQHSTQNEQHVQEYTSKHENLRDCPNYLSICYLVYWSNGWRTIWS